MNNQNVLAGKKLELKRESLRNISDVEMSAVNGGGAAATIAATITAHWTLILLVLV